MPGIVVVGVGPGIGQAVAARFAREGYPVGLIARSEATVKAAAKHVATVRATVRAAATGAAARSDVPVVTATADVSDEAALRAALDQVAGELGIPDVIVYNAAKIQADGPADLSAADHVDAYAVNVVGALTTANQLIPGMVERGSGSFIVTGGMPEPKPDYVSLSIGKAAVRALVTLLDQNYGEAGIHAATVTVAGYVAAGTDFDPADIAEHYWRVHSQPRGEWTREFVYSGKLS